ncbi:MAG: response regulator [Hyphomicrobiales bacterium]
MGLSENVAHQLPYLRRFSRALTGSQESGDHYVAALLQAVIADPDMINGAPDLRIALFSGFCRVWNSLHINGRAEVATPAWEAAVVTKLGNLPGLPRQVFLLHGLESFKVPEIAAILNLSSEHVEDLLASANAEIARMLTCKVLIVEDEPLIAIDLEDIVQSLGHQVTAVARTRDEAVKAARLAPPELVLSDIQLADGSSGIDAANDILGSFDVPVIFITAFPERLLTGRKPEPAFLITKPFSADMIKAVIAQALFFDVKSKKAA